MSYNLFSILVTVLSMITFTLSAADASKTLNPSDCSEEILHSFFPKVFVDVVLKKYNVPQDKWDAINKDLTVADKQVFSALENKSKELSGDPRQDTQIRSEFINFFRTNISKNFNEVLNKFGILDEKQLEAMLEEIQQLKLERFEACYGQEGPEDNHQEQSAKK